jgi:hypothetical protein
VTRLNLSGKASAKGTAKAMRFNLGGKASAKETAKATRVGGKVSAKGASTTIAAKYPLENLAHTPLAAKHLP